MRHLVRIWMDELTTDHVGQRSANDHDVALRELDLALAVLDDLIGPRDARCFRQAVER